MLPKFRLARAICAFVFHAALLLAASFGAGVDAAAAATPVLTVTPSSVTLGTGETQFFFVSVTGSAGVPTGTTALTLNGNPLGSTVLNNGEGGFVVKNLPVGQSNATATYQGDGNYSSVSVPVTIITTAATMESATGLLAIPATIQPGDPTQLQAVVQGTQSGATPTGTVVFKDGATTLGSGPLDANGQATYFALGLTSGAHSMVASYSGDNTYWPSVSSPVTVTVSSPATPGISLTADPPAANAGQTVTLTTKLTPPQGMQTIPTGSVTYDLGQTQLGVSNLDSQGVSTLALSTLPAGADSVQAIYTGDVNYKLAFTSTTVQITAAAVPPPADFSLSLSPAATVAPGKGSITTQIAITPVNGFSAQVSFVCSGLPAMSTCSFSPAALAAGAQSGPVAMTITTGNAQTARLDGGEGRGSGGKAPGSKIAVAALSIFGLWTLSRRRRRWPLLIFAILLSAAGAGSLSGCGGSSAGSPAGVYAVVVTASSGSLTHTATLALEVK